MIDYVQHISLNTIHGAAKILANIAIIYILVDE